MSKVAIVLITILFMCILAMLQYFRDILFYFTRDTIKRHRDKKNDRWWYANKNIAKLIEDPLFWKKAALIAKKKNADIPAEDAGWIEVFESCRGMDCTCSPGREDCCRNLVVKDGKEFCRSYVNINKLCGLSDETATGSVGTLTPQECKDLTEYILRLQRETLPIGEQNV